MQRANIVVTSILAGLAFLSWVWVGYHGWRHWSISPAYLGISIVITACACVGWVLISIADARGAGETRCRKCGYILRGLSEPRCPECGTPI